MLSPRFLFAGVTVILEQINRIPRLVDPDIADEAAQQLRIYVINLDRSRERWERLCSQAMEYDLNITRIPAVDGRVIAERDRIDFHPKSFIYHNGRKLLPGEYGCYRSHLLALEQFVASGDKMAIIMEDDVELNERLIPRAIAAMESVQGARLVKLVNHRLVGFKAIRETTENDVVGRCMHGPQGSAACYIVNRKAAKKLLTTLKPMLLPYDVALERGWSTGVETFTTFENLVDFSPHRAATTIGKRIHYRAVKRHPLLRLTAHWFRTCDQMRRWRYAVKEAAASLSER
ncbi:MULTISPECIES: glycosyltransferase family 25 protein [unclassified Rhizobium]|uniref:glycosyltransferase family 25 protein n=1 Tax=unclassified Rhizobium TaxID=2613769 RepID=UPI001622FBC9|nr:MULTISPECIES: glycosyltransferase family 25 protein [unclassified Rhizobium]MBB3287245.1 glycosyl transferase family 25 [Rhizobium sp. BK252]MBB3401985.1 glycosyl transferase family 25 [Rhizobium sp. BK289]MBB3414562.1 glycosyl transferase family 25 [Rhizobium sp. BK284]MBB3482451.1 glycosyl transferase family 25 [Rhizobium sp. BK347]